MDTTESPTSVRLAHKTLWEDMRPADEDVVGIQTFPLASKPRRV